MYIDSQLLQMYNQRNYRLFKERIENDEM